MATVPRRGRRRGGRVGAAVGAAAVGVAAVGVAAVKDARRPPLGAGGEENEVGTARSKCTPKQEACLRLPLGRTLCTMLGLAHAAARGPSADSRMVSPMRVPPSLTRPVKPTVTWPWMTAKAARRAVRLRRNPLCHCMASPCRTHRRAPRQGVRRRKRCAIRSWPNPARVYHPLSRRPPASASLAHGDAVRYGIILQGHRVSRYADQPRV